jgi:hypothetical protein
MRTCVRECGRYAFADKLRTAQTCVCALKARTCVSAAQACICASQRITWMCVYAFNGDTAGTSRTALVLFAWDASPGSDPNRALRGVRSYSSHHTVTIPHSPLLCPALPFYTAIMLGKMSKTGKDLSQTVQLYRHTRAMLAQGPGSFHQFHGIVLQRFFQ